VCARHDVPLVVHQNSGSTGQGPTAYIPELEELLGRSPDLDIVWAHGGVNEEHVISPTAMLDRLLGDHRRLHIDISWATTEVVSAHDHVAHDWLDLVAAHPDRFLWGSDSVGSFDDIPGIAHRIAAFLDQLPAPARDAVAAGNARWLFFERG